MAHLSEPEKLGEGIQVAFIATLMAVGLANAVLMPISVSLRSKDATEASERRMILEGIMAIQAGDNPRIVARKLDTYLEPAELTLLEAERDQPAAAETTAEAAA
jgi:chemotaxis protein MotA